MTGMTDWYPANVRRNKYGDLTLMARRDERDVLRFAVFHRAMMIRFFGRNYKGAKLYIKSQGSKVDAMAAMKQYLLTLLERVAPENGAAQEAIEMAINHNMVQLTYDLESDVQRIMQQYDVIFEAFKDTLAI